METMETTTSTTTKTETETGLTITGDNVWCECTNFGPVIETNDIDENIIYVAKPSTKNAKTRTIDPETFEKINALLQSTEKEEVK